MLFDKKYNIIILSRGGPTLGHIGPGLPLRFWVFF
jgi:hypothetical protein